MPRWMVVVYQFEVVDIGPHWRETSGENSLEIDTFEEEDRAAAFIAERCFNYPNKYIRIFNLLRDEPFIEKMEPDSGRDLIEYVSYDDSEEAQYERNHLASLVSAEIAKLSIAAKAEKARLKAIEDTAKAELLKREADRKEEEQRREYERLRAIYEVK